MTVTVTAAPSTSPPNKYGGDPTAFDAAMQAHLTWQATSLVDEINAQNNENNQINNNINAAIGAGVSIATAANSAAAAAAAAAVSADLAVAAWTSSMAPAETLPAISQSAHYGTIVAQTIYDTSKDNDGGAWIKKCQDKSWYKETLGGNRWIGQQASVGAAWTAAGSATGAVYQSTADGKFYTPLSSSTQTEVFRGISNEFPAVAWAVAESGRVVVYDLAAPGVPMWRSFVATESTNWWGTGSAVLSVCAGIGKVVVGSNGGGGRMLDFAADRLVVLSTVVANNPLGGIAAANSAISWGSPQTTQILVNATVNSVAITYLPTSPVDLATGLKVPTIAVGTAGGVSVILDSGTVVNSALTGSVFGLSIAGSLLFTNRLEGTGYNVRFVNLKGIAASWAWTSISTPTTSLGAVAPVGGTQGQAVTYSGTGGGVVAVKANPASTAASMVAYITEKYNTGWMPGDIRGAYLSDVTAETVTGSGELVLTPDFASDTNWTKGTGWTISGGKLLFSAGGLYQSASQAINSVANRTYQITFTVDSISVSTVSFNTYDGYVGGTSLGSYNSVASAGTYTFYVKAASSTIAIAIQANNAALVAQIDNISVKLAEPDRSVKNKGMVVNGSLTKTSLGTAGSSLVAYSGFSAANYLEQPYNSDLDFGTGDFLICGWVKDTVSGSQMFHRGAYSGSYSGSAIGIASSSSKVWFRITDDAYATSDTFVGGSIVIDGNWHFVACVKSGSSFYIYADGRLDGTAAVTAAAASLSNASAVARLGIALDASGAMTTGSLALWRISATAPSADQIAQIYRDELPLMQGANCVIAGTSPAVTALAYSDKTDVLSVGTSQYRSDFKGLQRINAVAGAVTTLAAGGEAIATNGTLYQPAINLRDELARKDEQLAYYSQPPIFENYTATASQTAFLVPKGFKALALYKNGTLMREATTGVYWTRSNDGFQETCTLSVGATVSDWISLMCVKA